tara:strand:+ start:1202 stop:1471 length:270 start_codon:yes stop_codon:yes gene_type:complete
MSEEKEKIMASPFAEWIENLKNIRIDSDRKDFVDSSLNVKLRRGMGLSCKIIFYLPSKKMEKPEKNLKIKFLSTCDVTIILFYFLQLLL